MLNGLVPTGRVEMNWLEEITLEEAEILPTTSTTLLGLGLLIPNR